MTETLWACYILMTGIFASLLISYLLEDDDRLEELGTALVVAEVGARILVAMGWVVLIPSLLLLYVSDRLEEAHEDACDIPDPHQTRT